MFEPAPAIIAKTPTIVDPFKDFEYRGWQLSAQQYHTSFSKVTIKAAASLLAAVQAAVNTPHLDVACGAGYVSLAAAHQGLRSTGVDFAEAMIQLAQQQHPELDLRLGDAEDLPFADRTFGAVTMNFGLLHLGNPTKAVAEAHRVLKPNGRFAFTVWAKPEEAIGFSLVLKAIEKYGDTQISLPPGPPFFKYSDNAAAQTELAAAGFTELQTEKLPLIWELSSAAEFFAAFYQGTARTGGLLRAQAERDLEAIRGAVEAEVAERYSVNGGVEIPLPAWLYSGVKNSESQS